MLSTQKISRLGLSTQGLRLDAMCIVFLRLHLGWVPSMGVLQKWWIKNPISMDENWGYPHDSGNLKISEWYYHLRNIWDSGLWNRLLNCMHVNLYATSIHIYWHIYKYVSTSGLKYSRYGWRHLEYIYPYVYIYIYPQSRVLNTGDHCG